MAGGEASHRHRIAAARSSQQAGGEVVPEGSGGQIGRKIYQICFLSASLYFVLATCRPLWGFLRAGSNEYNDRLTRANCRGRSMWGPGTNVPTYGGAPQ